MIVEFEQEYLSELYKTGQCKSKNTGFSLTLSLSIKNV